MTPWFKRHPEYLRRETVALTKDPNYRQLFLERNKLLVSHGYIIVRMEKIYKFPFLIVYPPMTPYGLPWFYPLKNPLSKEEVVEISKLTAAELFNRIEPNIYWYFGLRHQNGGGILCVLEWDNLDDGAKFYGISTLLRRVRDWCQGTITGDFPPDNQEVEYIAHFNRVDSSIILLYNSSFLNSDLRQGEAFAHLYTYLPGNNAKKEGLMGYLSVLMLGTNSSGIALPASILPNFFVTNGIANEEELLQKREVIGKMITDDTLLKMFWFDVVKEPPPFETFNDLIEIIGGGEREAGLRRISAVVGDQLNSKPDDIYFALRFPNRKSALEFQLFRIKKTGQNGGLFHTSQKAIIQQLSGDYNNVMAVRSTEFTDEKFHLRNSGRADRQSLLKKDVNIIGVGALGSEVADILNKAGIGLLSLFDNQIMRVENSVRHLVGIDYANKPKVNAVKEILFTHGPFNHVFPFILDINDPSFFDAISADSISISTIADDNPEAYLNERAIYYNKTIYYARALRGGKAARIFRVIPGRDACFNCLQKYREQGQLFVNIADDADLPTLKTECNNPIRPGSAADLKLISALTSRIVLDELQCGYRDANHWIWSTESIGDLHPFQLSAQILPPHPDCLYCRNEGSVQVSIDGKTIEYLQSLVARNTPVETGGVLAGCKDAHGNFHITHASDSGPNAKKSVRGFFKDVPYCQQFLDDLYVQSSGNTVYLGEWHSHPNSDNRPSTTDINSLSDIAIQDNYLIDNPVMIILSSNGKPSVTVHPAGKIFYHPTLNVNK